MRLSTRVNPALRTDEDGIVKRDPELQKLIDESAIRRLLAQYPHALDRQDHELLASLFHPDAIDDHGPYNGSAEGFVEFMKERGMSGHHWMHHNGTQLVDIQGDVAFTETYTLAFFREPAPDGKQSNREIFLRVRYLDRVEKREGQWRIAHRRVAYSPCHVLTVTEEFPMWEKTILEAGRDDASYVW
jgi:ketosteroid isomerase-like protein